MSNLRHRSNSVRLRDVGLVVMAFASCLAIGCTSSAPNSKVYLETEYTVSSLPADAPEGVVRYCWEEPIVDLEPNGPGLDLSGDWYQPKYTAIREVRQGRWRPCVPVESKASGRLK